MEHETKASQIVSIMTYGECDSASYPCHHMVDIKMEEKKGIPVHVRCRLAGDDYLRLHRLCALPGRSFHFEKFMWGIRKESPLDHMRIHVEDDKFLVVIADKESDVYRDRVYQFQKEERLEIESRILQENKKMEQARKNIFELNSLLLNLKT